MSEGNFTPEDQAGFTPEPRPKPVRKIKREYGVHTGKPADRPQPIDYQEFKTNLRERLVRLTPAFHEVRQSLGIGEEIGLGFVERVHEGSGSDSFGAFPKLKGAKLNRLRITAPGLFVGEEDVQLTQRDIDNIVVMPNLDLPNKRIVSIFQDNPYENNNLLEASDAVFVGLMAHEIAHRYDGAERRLPAYVQQVLKQRRRNIRKEQKEKAQSGEPVNKNHSFADHEAEIDIIASLMGYRTEIVAKLDYVISKLKPQPQGKFAPLLGRRSPQDLKEELEYRKAQVLQYAVIDRDSEVSARV